MLGRHTLVLLEGVVPCLRNAMKMIGTEPCAIGHRHALAPEELVTLIELVERVDGAIVCRDF